MTIASDSKINVLVVDDDPDMSWVLKDFLEGEGFVVSIASGGREALEFVKASPEFNLIILDVAMPNMNGVDALSEIKKITPKVKVLMITAFRDDEIVKEAMLKGALGCIYKPFDLKYIRKIVGDMISDD